MSDFSSTGAVCLVLLHVTIVVGKYDPRRSNFDLLFIKEVFFIALFSINDRLVPVNLFMISGPCRCHKERYLIGSRYL